MAGDSRNNEVQMLELLLGLSLPDSYKTFLLGSEHTTVNGLPILGLPVDLSLSSALGATELVRSSRSDLETKYVAIRLLDCRALCLEISDPRSSSDAPLVEINLRDGTPPEYVHPSFKQYVEEGVQKNQEILLAVNRLENLQKLSGEKNPACNMSRFDHKIADRFPEAKQRREYRCCVHDHIVGLTALQFDKKINGLIIDVFLATDHPGYQEGHGVQALVTLILSDAYKCGGSMALQFTGNVNAGRIPDDLVYLGKMFGIAFKHAEEGHIDHDESVALYGHLTGLSTETQEIIKRLHKCGQNISIEGISFLIAADIWKNHEVEWVLKNFSRPEDLLLGMDKPENRLKYCESISFGCAALGISKLQQKIAADISVDKDNQVIEDAACTVSIKNNIATFHANYPYALPWTNVAERLLMDPNETLHAAPLPVKYRHTFGEVVKKYASLMNDQRSAVLTTKEAEEDPQFDKISEELHKNTRASLMVLPFRFDELEQEVASKMMRAGRVRQ